MRQALGRGLDALIPGDAAAPQSGARKLPIAAVRPNRHQPRRRFPPKSLEALAASIRAHGLTQPIVVCEDGGPGRFELIAGERRLRAAKLAGLTEIDAVVRPAPPDSERLALALVENLQREDLNPIEEALALKRLTAEFAMTQAQIAESLGRSRPAVANLLRLLDLEPEILDSVRDGRLAEGHARALLAIEEPARRRDVWLRAMAEGWNVRAIEKAAKAARAPATPEKAPPEARAIQESLQHLFGTKVELKLRPRGRGTVKIHFFSLADFDRLMTVFKKAGL